ncbi:hypothetical protein HDU67_008901 [Dinochytrium kinnereticum]|nr:hypothetical protein HDU67_008901 [Dinochytrium kinnereticum]
MSRAMPDLRANTAPAMLRPISPSRSNSTRMSTIYRGRPDEPFKSVTAEDINLAFARLSSDGKKITKEDVKQGLERYFPSLSGKLLKLFNAGKAEMSKDALVALLLSRSSTQDHFEDAFEMFEPGENGVILDSTFLQMTRELNKYNMPQKGDIAAIKSRFDRDKDGEISYEDFKRMNMRSLP